MNWISSPVPTLKPDFNDHALQRQAQLTKPAGSLGKLENIAVRLANIQQSKQPCVDNVAIAIFAADHGIAEEGVSAFPQEVTAQMVFNFLQGGAAISVLSKHLQAHFEIIDVGVVSELPPHENLIVERAGSATANILHQEAMTEEQLSQALNTGRDAVKRALKSGAQIFIGGEMGIANTTSASILYCALLGLTAEQATGAGTGLASDGIKHKVAIVKAVLEKHSNCSNDALAWLRCAGGFEIAALTGAYIHAAQSGLAVLVDGFISSVAALCATQILSGVNDYLFFSHVSHEQGHRLALEKLQQAPLLDLHMRLGEGSGAAIAMPLLQSACHLHNEMATFEEASVASQS